MGERKIVRVWIGELRRKEKETLQSDLGGVTLNLRENVIFLHLNQDKYYYH